MILEDSATFHYLMDRGEKKGRLEERRTMILELGSERFGPASPELVERINKITDADRLRAISRRMLQAAVTSWEQLLDENAGT